MKTVNHYLKKFTLIVLALQILNLSIYNTNFYVLNIFETTRAEVTDENPIDSFAEFVVEDIGGITNAFPEIPQKTDKQSGELKQNLVFKMIDQHHFARIPEKEPFIADARKAELPLFRDNYSFLFWEEINHPPS